MQFILIKDGADEDKLVYKVAQDATEWKRMTFGGIFLKLASRLIGTKFRRDWMWSSSENELTQASHVMSHMVLWTPLLISSRCIMVGRGMQSGTPNLSSLQTRPNKDFMIKINDFVFLLEIVQQDSQVDFLFCVKTFDMTIKSGARG